MHHQNEPAVKPTFAVTEQSKAKQWPLVMHFPNSYSLNPSLPCPPTAVPANPSPDDTKLYNVVMDRLAACRVECVGRAFEWSTVKKKDSTKLKSQFSSVNCISRTFRGHHSQLQPLVSFPFQFPTRGAPHCYGDPHYYGAPHYITHYYGAPRLRRSAPRSLHYSLHYYGAPRRSARSVPHYVAPHFTLLITLPRPSPEFKRTSSFEQVQKNLAVARWRGGATTVEHRISLKNSNPTL